VQIIATIVLGFVALVIITLLAAALALVRILRGPRASQGATSAQDAQTMRELHTGLSRMEQRIRALETILMDRQGKEGQT
jgi:phage shock protein B